MPGQMTGERIEGGNTCLEFEASQCEAFFIKIAIPNCLNGLF
jgi:hypothetical protein